jgi:hypothetical protein
MLVLHANERSNPKSIRAAMAENLAWRFLE